MVEKKSLTLYWSKKTLYSVLVWHFHFPVF